MPELFFQEAETFDVALQEHAKLGHSVMQADNPTTKCIGFHCIPCNNTWCTPFNKMAWRPHYRQMWVFMNDRRKYLDHLNQSAGEANLLKEEEGPGVNCWDLLLDD